MATMEIYTITGGEIIRSFYDATAAMFGSGGITGLFKNALIIGGVWTVGHFIIKRDLRHFFGFMLRYVFAIAFILTPVCKVHIIDRTDPLNSALFVDNVPLALGFVGGLSSTLSDRMVRLFELYFHSPNDIDYSQTGMIMGAKLYLSASNIKITDAGFNANMQKFMQQCVFYDLMYNRYGLQELNQSTDIWALVKSNASVARGIIYNRSFKSCFEAAQLLDSAFESVITDAKSKYAGFAFGNHTDKLANFDKYLPSSYKYLTQLSSDASDIVRQNMMANAIRDGVFTMGSRVNSKSAIDSFASSRAQEKIPATLTNMGLMSAYWLPIIHSALFCIIVGCFVFVLFSLPFPAGLSFCQMYGTLYVWLGMWAPVFTVINYIMTGVAQFSLSFAKNGSMTLVWQSGINQMYENMAAVGGYLAAGTITLSYMLISRSIGSLITLAQQTNGVTQSAAASSAEEAQMGNYHYGNTSFDNHSGFNTNAFHNDQNARISVGGVETSLDGGSVARMARNGSETIAMATGTSHTPLGIQLGESTRAGFSELSDNAKSTALNQSIASSEQYGASLRSLVELGDTQSHGSQSGDGYQISNSAGFNTAASKVANLVDTFAHDHNISRDHAMRALAAASVSLNASVGVGKQNSSPVGGVLGLLRGGVDVNGSLRKELDSSHTEQNSQIDNDARRFTDETHFNDVVNQARQATKDTHFRTSDDRNERLADNFSTGYDKAIHYREEAVASFTESETYHRQASMGHEEISSINLDAQTGFIDWLSHHRAPNSHGRIGLQQAEWLIRNEPEMAQSYAREYIAEKTSQSIRQFQQKHHINPQHATQIHNQYKEQVPGNERVHAALDEYSNAFNERAKTVNAGTVDKGAMESVNKDFKDTRKDIIERTDTIVQEGSSLAQGVISSQSKKDVN